MKYAYSLLYTLIICVVSLSGFTACSNPDEVSDDPNQSDLKSDSLNEDRWTDETEEEDSTLPVGEAGKSDGAGGEPSKD